MCDEPGGPFHDVPRNLESCRGSGTNQRAATVTSPSFRSGFWSVGSGAAGSLVWA
jgi:hypothetical protein